MDSPVLQLDRKAGWSREHYSTPLGSMEFETRVYTGCFPLPFWPTLASSGSDGKDYCLENIAYDNETVWCSSKAPPVHITFQVPLPVTLTEFVIKAPGALCNCPARTLELIAFEKAQQSELCAKDYLVKLEAQISSSTKCLKHVFSRPITNVEAIIITIKDVDNWQQTNVDLQYVGFGGFIGSHSFPFASFI